MQLADTVHRQPAGSQTHDGWLDWLRGLAALMVLWHHGRQAWFVAWSDLDPASQTPLNEFLFFITGLGREAVVIFFVLSGWLVGGQALRAYQTGVYSLRGYLIARISRLYVVIVPALLLTAVIDYFGGAWAGQDHSLSLFLVNLFSLQGLFGHAYGSNGPLWSLAYEWWFYVLWGFALAAFAYSGRLRAVALFVVVSSIALIAWRCPGILEMFTLWLLGVVARSLPPSRWPPSVTAPLALIGLCLAIAFPVAQSDFVRDGLVGIAAAMLVYFCTGLRAPSARGFALGKSLAAFSFSLYALHYPLNLLLIDVFVPQRLREASVLNWLGCLLLMVAEALLCWCFYWFFERHTPAVRAALMRCCRRRLSIY